MASPVEHLLTIVNRTKGLQRRGWKIIVPGGYLLTRKPLFLVRIESLVCTVGVIGPSHFAGAVGMRSRASRRRLSDHDIRCSASDRRWFPAHPAQHVHSNHGKGRRQSAIASAHGRNGKRRVETSSAGRAGAHRPSEALHPTRSSNAAVADRTGSASLPCHVAKTRRNVPRRIAQTAHFERNDVTIICETVHQGFSAEMQSIRPRSGSNPRLLGSFVPFTILMECPKE